MTLGYRCSFYYRRWHWWRAPEVFVWDPTLPEKLEELAAATARLAQAFARAAYWIGKFKVSGRA